MLSIAIHKHPVPKMLCGAFMISFSGVFVKLAEVSPTSSAFYRVFLGGIFLLIATTWSKELRKPTPKETILLFFCGSVFALDLYFWHASIIYIGPGLATLLGNFQVFLLAAAGILFFREKSRPRFFAAIPLAITGLILIVGIRWNSLGDDYKTGIYFGLLTALCYTAFLLSLRHIQSERKQPLFFSLMVVSFFSAIVLGLTMLGAGDSFAITSTRSLVFLVGLGLFSQTVGWVLIANAMPKIRASFTGLILLLQPTLAFIWDVLLFKRPTDMVNWVGVIITLMAIYLGLTGKTGQRN